MTVSDFRLLPCRAVRSWTSVFVWPLVIGCLLTTSAARAQGPPVPAFYVATNGRDSWSGQSATPNAKHTDGPFATIERARQAAASGSPPARPVQVQIRGGRYELAEPLRFDAGDSATVYAAYRGEKPVLSGGRRITGWKQTAPQRWEARLPEVAAGKWYFSQLFVNGARRYRPRVPKGGYAFVAGELPPTPENAAKGFDQFRFSAGQMRPDWHDLPNIEVLPFQIWEMSRFHIRSVDAASSTVQFTGHTQGTASWAGMHRGDRYLIENVREALSEPGEWYLDRPSGILTYLARRGEDPNRDTVVAPRIEQLVRIDNASALTFTGITFSDTNWNLPPEGHSEGQAESGMSAAIQLVGARSCAFVNCDIGHTGAYAVAIGAACRDCRVLGCRLIDLGAGGVRIGVTNGWSSTLPPDKLTRGNTVTETVIAEGGRLHPGGVGVLILNAESTRVEYNEITDFYYTGISVGWSWGYGPSGARDNTIADNHIHRIGQGVLSDMGGIYTLGVSPGTVLDHNLLHDIVSNDYGGWGIYFDEGSTGILATNNIVYDVKSEPFHQHYGTNNVVRNNILALGREAQLRRSRGDNGGQATPEQRAALSFTLRNNLIYTKGAPLFDADWNGSNFGLESNLYWSAAPKNPARFPGNRTLTEWQAAGHDAGSVVADPLFTAPERGDFSLRAGSPAVGIGFVPFRLPFTGPRTPDNYRGDAPRAFPSPPPSRPIADNFEETPVGEKPSEPLLVLNEETDFPKANIRVTDETAATGRHSLKFTDAPGQRVSYDPHLYYHPSFTEGTVTGRFALRLEPGAVFYHEWRDSASPYHSGPSIRVGADGVLTASGKPTVALPRGKWVGITITCGLGDAASGTYELRVELPGTAVPRIFKNLPCESGTAFHALTWWGFVSDGTTAGVFYMDDLSLIGK